MSRRTLVAVVVALAVVAGVLFVGGPAPGGTPGGSDSTPTTDAPAPTVGTATATGTETATGTPVATGGTTATTASGYDFAIVNVETCGNTCRDVTARLSNTGTTARESVRVTTKVFADGDLLWTGNESVGRLAPGDSHTSTKRVQVGFSGGLKIRANDGYVTIVTVVRSASGTARFEDRRKVA